MLDIQNQTKLVSFSFRTFVCSVFGKKTYREIDSKNLLEKIYCTYRVSPIIRPTRKIRPSVIFEDDFNISPTLKISPSWERQKDERYYLWQVMASGKKIYMVMACMYKYTYILIYQYMLMASKCRSFFVISVYLKSRNFYFVTSSFDISK